MTDGEADQSTIEERIEEVEETVDGARETAEDVLGEERVGEMTDEARDLFDDVDDAARNELAEVEADDVRDVGAPIPTARQMLRLGLGAVPVCLGLVLLALPGVPTRLAGGLLVFSLVALAAVTLTEKFRGTSEARDVAAGYLLGVVFGSVAMALIQVAALAWNLL